MHELKKCTVVHMEYPCAQLRWMHIYMHALLLLLKRNGKKKEKIKFQRVDALSDDMRDTHTTDHRLFQFKRFYGRRHEHVKKSINYSGDCLRAARIGQDRSRKQGESDETSLRRSSPETGCDPCPLLLMHC
jgi:hypothetical protein